MPKSQRTCDTPNTLHRTGHGAGLRSASMIAGLIVLSVLAGQSAAVRAADEKAAPTAYVMLPGSDDLMADAHYLLDLTTPAEQKQWPILKDYFEVFLFGVDPKQPTRVGVVFGEKADRYVWSVPISKFAQFKKNVVAAIITPRIKQIAPNLYKLGSGRPGDFNGFMLFADPYVHIGETQKDVTALPADPRPDLQSLVSRNYMAAVELQNKETDAASQAKRHELFQITRKQSLDGLKKDKSEKPETFELRKKALEIQLGETEWFFAECQQAHLELAVDRNTGTGKLDLDLTPIAGTPLAQSIEQLQTKPSHFANVEKTADPILSVRLNHPLSEVRKKTASAMATLAKDRLKVRTDGDEKLSADQKEAMKQIIDQTFAIIEASFQAGLADGFVDVHKGSSGKNVLLAASWTPDGTKVGEILALFPKARAGENVKMNVAEESGVAIHSVDLTKDQSPHFLNFIGETTLYVGASKEAIWVAAGEGALDSLKAAIKKAAQPAAAGAEKAPFGEFVVRLKPWAEEMAAEPAKKKGDDKYRKMLSASLEGGDDTMTGTIKRQDNKIVGEITMQKGILRFAGKAASDFSRENLDESSQKKTSKQARENGR
jgi:hypothetical protein